MIDCVTKFAFKHKQVPEAHHHSLHPEHLTRQEVLNVVPAETEIPSVPEHVDPQVLCPQGDQGDHPLPSDLEPMALPKVADHLPPLSGAKRSLTLHTVNIGPMCPSQTLFVYLFPLNTA